MYIKRPSTLATGAAILLGISGVVLPATVTYAAEQVRVPLIPYDLANPAPANSEAVTTPGDIGLNNPSAVEPAVSSPDSTTVPAPKVAASVDPVSVECMAKVVLHEAGNQPHAGKIAVAQTLVNRLKAGRFGGSICEVVSQPGQFFQISRFHPQRDTDGWQDAVEVAHEVLAGQTEPVAPAPCSSALPMRPPTAFSVRASA